MKSKKLEWLIIGILAIALIGSTVFYYYSLDKKSNAKVKPAENKEVERLLTNYSELEASYNNAIGDIEKQVNVGDVGIDILKQNLAQILDEIKEDKKQIEAKKYVKNIDSLQFHYDQAEQMKQMLKMSKEVLVERLAEVQKKNKDLQVSNQKLLTRNEKLVVKVKKINNYVEREKVKNQALKAEVIKVQQRIDKVAEKGDTAKKMMEKLQKEKKYFEQKLDESTQMIKVQNEQISELGVIVKKVNAECYFVYQEGNPDEEAEIFLTKGGISQRYMRYFTKNKPDVHFDFTINNYMFEEGSERIDFKLFNRDSIELFSTSKAISSGILKYIVPNKHFKSNGKYTITLFEGQDNLLINDKYEFIISK